LSCRHWNARALIAVRALGGNSWVTELKWLHNFKPVFKRTYWGKSL